MSGGPRIALRPGALAWREVEGEVLVLDVARSEYLAANESASSLWPRLAEGATPGELADALQAEHDLPRERAEADVAAFVGLLRARGLVDES